MSNKNTTIEVKFTGDSKGLKSAATESSKAVGDMADDVESAGKQMARALEDSARDMIDEIDRTAAAVKAMETALDGVDIDPTQAVADLKRMGLTADEVRADADRLAQGLKAVGDVPVYAKSQGFDDLDSALGDTDSKGRAASTAIGGIGNSVSELPGVGALGPMAESMGQLAEGALEGDIGLKSLVATGLGLGAVALVAKGIEGHFAKIAAAKAFREDQVRAWSDALREGETLLGEINDELMSTGRIELQGWDGIFNLTPLLREAGLTVDDWTAAVQGNDEQQHAFLKTMEQVHGEGETLLDVVVGLKTASENYTTASKENADALAVQSRETITMETATGLADAAIRELASDLGEAARESKELKDSHAELKGEFSDREAFLNLGQTFDDLKAQGESAYAAVAAGTMTAEQAAREHELAVLALKQEIIDYSNNVAAIPPEKLTDINAAIDRGDLEYAETQLNNLTRPRDLYVNVRTNAQGELGPVRIGGRASGGPVRAGDVVTVNDDPGRGPELIRMEGNGTVIPAGQSRGMQRGNVVQQTTIVNMPNGVRPIPVRNADRAYDRIQGPL